MEAFLVQLGSMSLQAAVIVVVVLVLRLIFEKVHIAKKYTMLLWLVPYISMACPWKFTAPYSFWGKGETLFDKLGRIASSMEYKLFTNPNAQPLAGIGESASSVVQSGQLLQNEQLAQMQGSQLMQGTQMQSGEGMFENVAATLGTMTASDFLYVGLFGAWLAGFLMVSGYCLFSYIKLKKRLICSEALEENIFCADDIETAFVVGFARPKIYLPSNIRKEYAGYVIAHEKTHIRRFDPWKKLLALFITCVHWFNPLAWAAFVIMGKDMEMTCDEETVARLGVETKKNYANALLQLSAAKAPLLYAPLAFGEGSTKERIRNIVNYKKTLWIVAVLAVLVTVFVAIGFFGKASDYVTLGSGEVEWITIPEDTEQPVVILYHDGSETEFVAFPSADGYYEEMFAGFLKEVEVNINPLSMSRAEDRPKDISIRIGSVYFNFNGDMSELWFDNGVKPTYSYEVRNPKVLREFVEVQLDSTTEAVEATPTEAPSTEVTQEPEIQDGYLTVGMSGYNHDHSLYETFGVGGDYTLVASYEANLNHDESSMKVSTDELVEVYTGNVGDGDSGFVLFTSGEANDPYSIEAHVARAGWTSIYLIDTEVNDYLFELTMEIREGFGNLSYMVYHFGEQLGPKIPVVINDSVTYSYEGDTFDEKAFEIWASGMENYLNDAKLLLSTQDGILRTEPSNDLELYNAKTILEQIEESMEGLHQSAMMKKTEGIENGYPAIPYFAPGDDVVIDATGTSLDYADENIVVFHDYYGLFVYDINEQEIVGAISLEPIGCNYTQGDNYCEVMVDDEGTTIYLHPLSEKEMYVYGITTGVLTQEKYNMDGIEVFDNFEKKEDITGWDHTVFQTRNIVQVSKENWIHMESGSGLIQDLAVVVTKDGKQESYLKVFENYYRHLILVP